MTINIKMEANEKITDAHCGECRFLEKSGLCGVFNFNNYFCQDEEKFERNCMCLEFGGDA